MLLWSLYLGSQPPASGGYFWAGVGLMMIGFGNVCGAVEGLRRR